jgi:hypothetical protein
MAASSAKLSARVGVDGVRPPFSTLPHFRTLK